MHVAVVVRGGRRRGREEVFQEERGGESEAKAGSSSLSGETLASTKRQGWTIGLRIILSELRLAHGDWMLVWYSGSISSPC